MILKTYSTKPLKPFKASKIFCKNNLNKTEYANNKTLGFKSTFLFPLILCLWLLTSKNSIKRTGV